MSWARVRGHESLRRHFEGNWKRGRLGHAFLFIGPTGVGKHTFARELAKALLCERSKETLVACDQCAGCSMVAAESHPDLFLAARPEDKVDLPLELIQTLIEHLSLKPSRGSRKLAILDDADDMTDQAANAFLKTLEEPSPGSVLILIGGAMPDRQYQTILSRCQVVAFAPLGEEDLSAMLLDAGIQDQKERRRLARVSGGSFGQAMALNDPTLWEFRGRLQQALVAEKLDAFGLSQAWTEYVEDAGKEGGVKRRRAALVLRLLIGMLQDALRIHQGVPPRVADAAEAETLNRLAARLGPDKLMRWIDRALEADVQIDRRVQLELILEAFVDAYAR